ncbi:MAG: MASE1 domain-containing protein, partial [Anaerolineales bacterium]|nr:MASE1 domain-containing protein [Anaerolineales bacterium]
MNSLRIIQDSNGRKFRSWLWQVVLLAIVYHLAARLGLSMAYLQDNTSPVWPPTGIAIAALLFFGVSRWPGITLGVLLGSLLTGAPFNLALGMSIGNTLEALIGAYILQRYVNFHHAMDRVQDVIGLVVVAIFSTMLSATAGASTLVLIDFASADAYGSIWITWWIGDLLGALVVAPVILAWLKTEIKLGSRKKIIEVTLAFILLGTVTWYVFIYQTQASIYHQALLYLIFPFVIWTAIRFGQRGGTTAVIMVSGMAIWATVAGLGPFSLHSKNDNLILLQTFLGVVSLTSLILAAATMERLQASRTLQRRADDLATLNESSRIFLDARNPGSIYQTICELAISRIGMAAAWIERKGNVGEQPDPLAICGISNDAFQQLDISAYMLTYSADPEQTHVFKFDRTAPTR